MSKFNVACIGTGYFSQFHYDAWRRIDDVNLIASVSLNLKEAEATGLASFDNTADMLRKATPDIVDIITAPPDHLELINLCAKHGVRTIICQKPFCNSIAEAEAAVTICDEMGVSLLVHDNFRFQPWYRVIKHAIEDCLLGDIHQFTFRLRTGDGQGPDAYVDRQPYFQKMEKFLIRETGVHWIDTFCFLFGKPASVYADLCRRNPVIAGEDAGYFNMEFENGVRALFDANRHIDHDADNCRTTFGEGLLEGTKGTITLSGNGKVSFRKFGSREYEILLAEQNWQGFAGDCVYALQSGIIGAIKNGKKFELTAKDYLTVLKLEELVYQSNEQGRKIDLKDWESGYSAKI